MTFYQIENSALNNLISLHYKLQHGCFFSDLYYDERALFAYNDIMDCFIWNHVFPYNLNSNLEEVIADSERFLNSRQKNACIYLDNATNTETNKQILQASGYELVDIEAWMMYVPGSTQEETKKEEYLRMKCVADEEELDKFLEICTECFDNTYSMAIKREFNRYQVDKEVEHYLFYDENAYIVGIASIYSNKDSYFIHNVGVSQKHRKQGYGTSITNLLLYEITNKNNSNVKIVLQCDGETYKETMYKKIGFQNIYRRFGYLKNENR